MTRIQHFAMLAAIGLIALTFAHGVCGDEEEERRAQLKQLGDLSDPQLFDRLNSLLGQDDFRREFQYEACLTEIVRRGGKDGATQLQKQFDALMARKFKRVAGSDETEPGVTYNLELLTALRRIQGRRDPLRIAVEHGGGPLTVTPLSLPRLKVTIKNLDIERRDVGFMIGGNYRSGRPARWRLEVFDEQGNRVPTKQPYGLLSGGGLYQEGALQYGEAWETVIEMGEFIEPPSPGSYQVQVLYHNTRTILFWEDISGLIVCRSEKIPLVVGPTVIELTAKQHRQAVEWILALDSTAPVKVVAGTYGEWAHDFIAPDSPAGRLLQLGLAAAPALVESLRDETSSVEKRAWILSLLYSVTGINDPRRESVLAGYEYTSGPWQVLGGAPGEPASGGFGLASKGVSYGGKIDPANQQRLAKKWIEWLRTVTVKIADDE